MRSVGVARISPIRVAIGALCAVVLLSGSCTRTGPSSDPEIPTIQPVPTLAPAPEIPGLEPIPTPAPDAEISGVMPDLIGMSIWVAERRMPLEGIHVTVVTEVNDAPKGTVVAQSPEPGEGIDESVTLTVAVESAVSDVTDSPP